MAGQHRLALLPALVALAGLLAACTRGARSAEEAYTRLLEAVKARDGGRLYEAVDLETRWSWMTVHRAHREAYDITLSNFPEGPDRERQIRRFEAAAHAESPRELFARELPATVWTELDGAEGGTVRPAGEREAEVVTAAGKRLVFRKADKAWWGWGWAGLADQAKLLERRALADLDLIRTNAADLERAATRSAR